MLPARSPNFLTLFSSASSEIESNEESEEEEVRFVPRPELEKGITEAEIFNNYTAYALDELIFDFFSFLVASCEFI